MLAIPAVLTEEGRVTTRTYHPRQGRVSARHRTALADLWPRYGVAATGSLSAIALFGRRPADRAGDRLRHGRGDRWRWRRPTRAVTTSRSRSTRPGWRNLLALIERARTGQSSRLHDGDALELLEHSSRRPASTRCTCSSPTPGPRRAPQAAAHPAGARSRCCASRLRPGGTLHCATDCAATPSRCWTR